MIFLVLFGISGILAGFLLIWRVPLCRPARNPERCGVSVIIPARNEGRTLPRLLDSLQTREQDEVIVVDDHSTDETSVVASSLGARVLVSATLPAGWTGKTFACEQGAHAARNDHLLFLDADTWLEPGGLERILSQHRAAAGGAAISLLPYHQTVRPYEELSIFFNLLMAFGAGGWGTVGQGRLFGQSMLIPRDLYAECGRHAAVRDQILENFMLAERIRSAGGECVCFGGRKTLNMRMFPAGLGQLWEGWTKAFASGAAKSDARTLALAVYWLTVLCTVFLCIAVAPLRETALLLYTLLALQVAWMATQIGSFRWYTCAAYPVAMLFFFVLFSRAMYLRVSGAPVRWRGRSV